MTLINPVAAIGQDRAMLRSNDWQFGVVEKNRKQIHTRDRNQNQEH